MGSSDSIRQRSSALFAPARAAVNRVTMTLVPVEVEVPVHCYPPPFGPANTIRATRTKRKRASS